MSAPQAQTDKLHHVATGHQAQSNSVVDRDHENADSDGGKTPKNEPKSKIDLLELGLVVFAGIQCLIFTLQAWIGYNQLRAYVFFDDATIMRTGDRWHIDYRIKNGGISPAHKIQSTVIASVVDWEPKGPLPVPDDRDTLGSMGPGGDIVDLDATVPYDHATERAILAKTKAVILVGRITYQDKFGRRRRTDFCVYATGVIEKNGQQMSSWSEGNDSN